MDSSNKADRSYVRDSSTNLNSSINAKAAPTADSKAAAMMINDAAMQQAREQIGKGLTTGNVDMVQAGLQLASDQYQNMQQVDLGARTSEQGIFGKEVTAGGQLSAKTPGGGSKGGSASIGFGLKGGDARIEQSTASGRGDDYKTVELAQELMDEYQKGLATGYDPNVMQKQLAREGLQEIGDYVASVSKQPTQASKYQDMSDGNTAAQSARNAIVDGTNAVGNAVEDWHKEQREQVQKQREDQPGRQTRRGWRPYNE